MMLAAFVLLCGILSLSVTAENIIRHQCGTEATFYKIASNHSLNNGDNTVTLTTSEGVSGCIEFCVKNESCKAFNYKTISPVESICELLSNDRNTKDVVAREGWSYYDTGSFSSQIGQHCRKLSYNPCYPCLCMDSCHSSIGYSCNCTQESPCQPDIFIAFETTLTGNPTKTVYNRGKDRIENNVLTMINGATIGTVLDRPGKVLKIVGINAGAIVGNFQDSCINNPEAGLCSLSLWLRIVSPNPGHQTVIGTGRLKWNTGLLVRVYNNAKSIIARFVAPEKHLSTKTSLPDTLQSWTHLTVTSNWKSAKLVLYINGKIVAEGTTYGTTSASPTGHPDLIIGAGTLYPLVNDYWAMQLDDLAIWDGYLLKPEEVVYVMNQGFV
ncbi:uncharacterized protein LOC135686947 isoform X2 [Rhopilema esculentum]|uniref:uncharacterized protein LOC135686947 isoform X2 n=1 Tax=Rhopilema esculentum TaxID=499914 RepID=UPI0031D7E72E